MARFPTRCSQLANRQGIRHPAWNGAEAFDKLTFEYEPEEQGIDEEIAKQLTLGAIRKGVKDNVI